MRLHLYSDLHLDHDDRADADFIMNIRNDVQVADVAIIAGDLYSTGSPQATANFLGGLLDHYDQVIFVPGNHDYWLTSPEFMDRELDRCLCDQLTDDEFQRIHLAMEPRFVTIRTLGERQQFLCGTMWYPEPQPNQVSNFIDMRQTRVNRDWFFQQYQTFMKMVRAHNLEDTIVVTHHLPGPKSTPTRFASSPTNHFFATDVTQDILTSRPKMWLHGHTHDACDYTIGQTRVICSPRGYPHEYRFRPKYEPKLIEV